MAPWRPRSTRGRRRATSSACWTISIRRCSSATRRIPPVEVESAIAGHPDVLEASVVGLPDRDLGGVVGAAIVLRAGSALDTAALGRFLAERIADYKSPRRLRFLPALPRNPNGKVQRDEVRKLLNDD
jgi:acyl-coenzyme A synthetase/AMP-(fatty) acid ligase